MKHYKEDYTNSLEFDNHKNRQKQWRQQHKAGGFRCTHCKQFVVINNLMGTANRNHCNICLWSKHVDEAKGDRRARCQAGMKPIGLTFKHEGFGKVGEIMLIHLCCQCQKISINRVARDDGNDNILAVFHGSDDLSAMIRTRLKKTDVYLLQATDQKELMCQLLGS